MNRQEEDIYHNVPADLQDVAKLVKLMESSIKIPFINKTIGLEPIIGMVPVVGNFVSFGITAWVMVALLRNNASGKVIAKMILNIVIDFLITSVPVLGNILDFFFKANQRNLELALDHYRYGKNQGSALAVIIPVILLLTLIFGAFLALFIFFIYLLAQGFNAIF